MHNNNSNTNPSSNHRGPLEWANRFVPLPPTEFPDEVCINNFANERPIRELGTPSESPLNNANLPCLQDIAGVDPFFTPSQTPPASPPPNNPAADFSSIDQAPRAATVPPRVEVIGQHAEQAPAPNVTYAAPLPLTTPEEHQEQQKAEVELMNPSEFNNSNAEIHEYDLAMKVLPSTTAAESQDLNESTEIVDQTAAADKTEVTDSDISCYWSQDNVSSFIPGVTPIEAYPVCQAYAEQISASGESESITLSDIQLDKLLVNAANIKSDTALENADDVEPSLSDEDANQPEAVEASATVSAEENADKDTSLECLEIQLPEPFVPEMPNLAARQVETPSTIESGATEIETTDSQPMDQITELPNENEIYDVSDSNELFESVEKSLSDLQSINHCDSNAESCPATNANEVLSELEIASAAPVEPEPESAIVAPQATQQQALAPTFEPIDLTANLPSVHESEQQQSAEPDSLEEALAVDRTPVMPLAYQSEAQALLDADSSWNQPPVQPTEPEIAQDAPPVESATTLSEDSQQAPTLESVELADPAKQTSPQADDSADQQVQQPEEPVVTQEAASSESEPELGPDFQVIQVDGNDGYDFLDLKAFDVAHATFLPGKIYLNDGTTKFQIQYSNLKLAVFAGDFQVELT